MPEIVTLILQYPWICLGLLAACALMLALRLYCYRLYSQAVTTQQRCQESIENLSEGFYRATPEGKIVYANRALARMHGCSSPEELLARLGDSVADLYIDPKRSEEFRRLLHENGRVDEFISEIHRCCIGETCWVSENARIISDPKSGTPLYYEGSMRDVTEHAQRREFEKKLEKLATNLPGGLFQFVRHGDGRYSVPYLSVGFIKLLGLNRKAENLNPLDYFQNIHRDDRDTYLDKMRSSARSLTQWSCEFRYFRKNGKMLWLHLTATPERLGRDAIVWHGHISDISQRKNAEARVRHLADFDPLTQLPNRRVFTRCLDKVIGKCKGTRQHAAVLFIDLDNFKTLNDTYGHELGDELLRLVAERLNASARSSDTVSRFGGDEFVLLLEDLGESHQDAVAAASGAANKILREFAKGFDLGQIHHVTSPSIGAIVFDGQDTSASQIIKSADIAMYEAKKGGRNGFVLFDPNNFRDVSAGYALQSQLRQAIARNELFFEFQPLVETDGSISGCEALVRWQHPTRDRLAPGEFIPMAEKTGMIREINDWVLDQALKTLARWKATPAMRGMNLAVNISVQQFNSESFVPELLEKIGRSGIDASLLTLELTEHMMARNPEKVAASMAELKASGLRFSLDDFGTGYSSLSQLNSFPFDEVKIDGSFVAEIETSRSYRSLIEAILGMAAALGLDTVAEHVGSPFQIAFLKERGCRRFQGYFYHPPLAEGELVGLVSKTRPQPRPSLSLVK